MKIIGLAIVILAALAVEAGADIRVQHGFSGRVIARAGYQAGYAQRYYPRYVQPCPPAYYYRMYQYPPYYYITPQVRRDIYFVPFGWGR